MCLNCTLFLNLSPLCHYVTVEAGIAVVARLLATKADYRAKTKFITIHTRYFAIVKKEPTVERASIEPVYHLLLQSKINKKCMSDKLQVQNLSP